MPGPLRLPTPTPATDGSDTFEALGWKVFAPGYWKGELFSPARIANIVANYRAQKAANPDFAPRAKLGHDKQQRLAKSLGLPNAGRVTDLRPTDDGGFEIDVRGIPRTALITEPDPTEADPDNVKVTPVDLQQMFADGQYDSGSVEITPRVRHPERPTEWLNDVFDGVAFLGEENPAVKATARPRATPATAATTPSSLSASRTSDYSSGGVRVLCFSDYSEDPPVTPLTPDEKSVLIAQIAAAMGLQPDDPTLATMTDDQLRDMAAKVSSQQFSDHMKKTYSAPPPAPAGAGTGTGTGTTAFDPTSFMSDCKKMFSEMLTPMAKRLEAAEAAVTDVRKKGDDATTETLMSEAVRRVDACIQDGKLMPRLRETKLKDLRELAKDAKTFAEGADKGMTAFQAELKALEARPADLMFSDTPTAKADATADELDEWDRRAMSADPRGKLALRKLAAAK